MMTNLIGQSLGSYHILEQLGEGGMAIVYKAYDTRLERDVAIKVIRTERLTLETTPNALKRFEREAKALGKLTHPNIVPVSDYGEQDGKPYLVMPYLPSGTLKQKMGKPIPWQEAIQILLPVAEALDYAHSQNMIHRDVKPSNILLTQRGQPMLTDFGIAKILDLEETQDLTGTGVAVGTPEYMAPEQATSKAVDHRADIYSLGVVLYEMVAGRKPYIADTPMAVLIKHATEPLPRPKQFMPTLPDEVEKVLLKALAKKPEDRYQDMGKVVNAFEKLQREGGRRSVISTKSREDEGTPKPIAENNLALRPNILVMIVGLAALVLFAIFGLPSLMNKPEPTQPTELGLKDTSIPTAISTETTIPKATATLLPTQLPQQEPQERPTYTPKPGAGDGLIIQDCALGICPFAGIHVLSSSGITMKEIEIPEFAGKFIEYPVWSSDGTKIIFGISPASDPSHTSDIENLYLLDVQTEMLTQLTNIPENNTSPANPPDGKKIAFHWNCDVWMMNSDGSDLKKHFTHGKQCATQLRWSPDGQWLAWISPGDPDTGDGRSGTKYISIYNPTEKKIFSIPVDFDKNAHYNDAWSPDGSALYFSVDSSGNRQVYKLDTTCLQTSCGQADLAKVDFDLPESWFPNYYPQWGRTQSFILAPHLGASSANLFAEPARAFVNHFREITPLWEEKSAIR